MSCWEEQAEVSDGSCKSSQLSMAHSSFQRRISAAFCTCLTIKIKSCGLWVEAVLKYLCALSWLYHHPCCLPRRIKARRKGLLFFLSWFVRDRRAWPIHHTRCSQWPPSNASDLVLGKPCRRVAVPGFCSRAGISDAVKRVSDFCHNVWQSFCVCLPAHMQSSLLPESLSVYSS